MLFVVVQEPKQKWRHAYVIDLQFIEAKNKAAAIKQAERMADPAFKAPYAVPVHPGLKLGV